ncbi:hypothetical protein [Saccharopolyspora gregorii]|uniref:hypothetical protein n=1 Tax=Saccharopolyspora gregorii TaxID=33914 RepID=UPI0031EE7D3E
MPIRTNAAGMRGQGHLPPVLRELIPRPAVPSPRRAVPLARGASGSPRPTARTGTGCSPSWWWSTPPPCSGTGTWPRSTRSGTSWNWASIR